MSHSFIPLTFPDAIAAQLREENWSIALTGASGWMGQALLEMLEPVFGEAYDARVAAFGSVARVLPLRSGRQVPLKPTAELTQLPTGKWLLIHAAYGTKDRVGVQGNEAFIDANDQLTQIVTASLQSLKPQAILFPSSGAVYDASGAISTDLVANPYGVLKHRDEMHFATAAAQIGARIVIPRLFNMSGPYINKWSAYALSDLIVQLLDGKVLHIQSAGAVERSYLHVADLLTLSFHCLLDSTSPSPLIFDTRGEDVELAALARAIEETLLDAPRSTLRVPDPSAKASIYLGKAEPMQALLNRYDMTLLTLRAQIASTAEDIKRRRS